MMDSVLDGNIHQKYLPDGNDKFSLLQKDTTPT